MAKQAKDVEAVFVLASRFIVLPLVDFVNFGDKERRDTSHLDIESSIVWRIEGGDTKQFMVNHGCLETRGFACNLVSMRAEACAATT